MKAKERDHCVICGRRLCGRYRDFGRCAAHHLGSPESRAIADVAALAKEAGLSYGQYVAKERVCAAKRS